MHHHPPSINQSSPAMQFFFKRIFPLIFILIGASLTYSGVVEYNRSNASVEWPTTSGVIISSSVEYHKDDDDSVGTYHAKIRYEFRVNDALFDGSRVAYGDYGSSDASHAQNIVNQYHEGKNVTVYYMPSEPNECLLEPGFKLQTLGMPIIGLFFLIAGLLVAYYLPRSTHSNHP
jgi:hypothetical protein